MVNGEYDQENYVSMGVGQDMVLDGMHDFDESKEVKIYT